jgi:NADH:ubiquinone reductase (H+-translocating)
MESAKEVVVVGGGFGGLAAAKKLGRARGVRVTLVDQRNHHLFQPLLYQVATAGLNPADIAAPIRAQFTHAANVSVHLGRVDRVDLAGRTIEVAGLRRSYDYLVLACGALHSYFGKPEWEEVAPGLKTVEQALEIRRRILGAFEAAENEPDAAKSVALLTFVIVGAGPTGVELAGALADIARTVLVKDFRRINPASARVILLEAGPRVLPAFSEALSRHAAADLAKLGVEVRTSSPVEHVDASGVRAAGVDLPARSVFWAAGVQAEGIGRDMGVELDKAGRIKVRPDLSIPDHPEAFVVGDLAHLERSDGTLVPGLAPAAIQEGRAAARNILASIDGRPRQPFRYVDKGMMATIGKHRAIGQLGRLRFAGYFAWLAWLFVHILYLIGFRNRIAVLADWAWSYLFSKRSARLITERDWKLHA